MHASNVSITLLQAPGGPPVDKPNPWMRTPRKSKVLCLWSSLVSMPGVRRASTPYIPMTPP